jgi:two-component system cell cycle response regulator CpdR
MNAPSAPPPLAPQRILIIDDDPLILEAMRLVLESDHHIVATACGGATGITAFESACAAGEFFHVVMTDLNMPSIDGRQVAVAVKAAAPLTAVVLMSGSIDSPLIGSEGVIDLVVSKPPTRSEIRVALRTVAARRESP